MVDLSKLSADLKGRIEKIMSGDGQDAKKIDSRNEYNQLAQLLSGDGKVSGSEKAFVEGMLLDYEEEYMVRPDVKDRVKDIIKNGENNKADDNAEINDLKEYKKTKGLTKEEKKWIQAVIDGREVQNDAKTTTDKPKPAPEEPKPAPEEPKPAPEEPKKPEAPKTSPKKPKPTPKPGDTPLTKPVLPQPVLPQPVIIPTPPVRDIVNDNDMVNSNNGNINQRGQINIGGDVNIEIKKTGYDTVVDIPTPPDKGNSNINDSNGANKLSPTETNEARINGKDVANFLVGHTSETEQRFVYNIVKKEVNEENVLEFIRGYSDNKGWGDHFFEQLESEYGFEEAKNLMKDVAIKLCNHFKANGIEDLATEIEVILENNGYSKEQAKKLDELAIKGLDINYHNNNATNKVLKSITKATGVPGVGGLYHVIQDVRENFVSRLDN